MLASPGKQGFLGHLYQVAPALAQQEPEVEHPRISSLETVGIKQVEAGGLIA